MKLQTFILYFCFLLLGGKNYAATAIVTDALRHSSAETVSENKQSVLSNDNQTTIVIEDIDFDIEEEFAADNSLKNYNTFFAQHSLVTTLYTTNLTFSLSGFNKKSSKTFPHLNGNSCPIYIFHGVLRI